METDIRRKMFAHTHISFNCLTGLVTLFPSPVYSLDAPLSRLVALGMEMEVAMVAVSVFLPRRYRSVYLGLSVRRRWLFPFPFLEFIVCVFRSLSVRRWWLFPFSFQEFIGLRIRVSLFADEGCSHFASPVIFLLGGRDSYWSSAKMAVPVSSQEIIVCVFRSLSVRR